ncbi:MAG: hypothetical protein HND52_03000 [Ignavibacteriae bacterium]|jgi:hypothetical protein|nr:hypothetical protein [Ignavibacteriota bacterium]NOG96920.1 hypothetical protein [Ignavibacteriota bacterium]
MKKLFLILFLFISVSVSKAQIDLTAAMGINFVNSPSFNDYLNINFINSDEQLASFNSTINFMGEGAVTLTPSFQIAGEYVYEFYSITPASGKVPFYEASYAHHKPSAIAYYVISGTGYKLKFGGGAGIRFLSFEEQLPNSPVSTSHSTTGFGIVLKAQGYTLLSGNFYANIGGDLRYDLPGEPTNNGTPIIDRTIDENVNVNSVAFGFHLGIAYILN